VPLVVGMSGHGKTGRKRTRQSNKDEDKDKNDTKAIRKGFPGLFDINYFWDHKEDMKRRERAGWFWNVLRKAI